MDKITLTVTKGQCEDYDHGKKFIIEATVIHMTATGLMKWYNSETLNERECYETWEEWDAYRKDCERRRNDFELEIAADMGLDIMKAPPIITQSHAEFFTVIQIWEDLTFKQIKEGK